MISKINFCGKVTTSSNVKNSIHIQHLEKIKEYADRLDVDVFVYNKDAYLDGLGTYQAVVNKDGDIWMKTFDMYEAGRSYIYVPKKPTF